MSHSYGLRQNTLLFVGGWEQRRIFVIKYPFPRVRVRSRPQANRSLRLGVTSMRREGNTRSAAAAAEKIMIAVRIP